ncbi:MAG: TIM-barrel domain-containing protein, partial [Ferruginibacter sp.]
SLYNVFFFILLINVSVAESQTLNKLSQRKAADTNIILPPAWAFGLLYGGYTNQQQTINRIEEIKKHHYPVDAYWIDSWFWSYADKGIGPHKYIDFIADTTSYPNRTGMWQYMQQNGIKGGFWIWDCILEKGNENAFNDFKSKGFFSGIYTNKNSWHNNGTSTAMFQEKNEHPGTQCGNIDFDNPAAVNYFKQKMKPFFSEGADFIKLDRTSKISTCKAMFAMSQEFGKETKGRGFVLSHTGGQETEEYKRYPTKWTDDTRSDWTIEKPLVEFNTWVPHVSLKENIALYTDTGKPTSKIPFLANDLGGFDMGETVKPDEELYIRWLQFSMFNPITEVFSQPENPTSNLAWLYSQRADSIFRFYAQWRMQLFPYIYSFAHRSRIEAKPVMGLIPGHLYQFMFGDELLAAPVYEKGILIQKIFLPEGKWINYWTEELMEGNVEYIVSAPLNQMPLFVKKGAIIPLRHYASSIEKGNNDILSLHVYPGDNSKFNLLEDDGLSNDYLKGIYASTIIELKKNTNGYVLRVNPVEGRYKGMNPYRKWELMIHSDKRPVRISLYHQHLKFRYDKTKKITVIALPKKLKTQLVEIKIIF